MNRETPKWLVLIPVIVGIFLLHTCRDPQKMQDTMSKANQASISYQTGFLNSAKSVVPKGIKAPSLEAVLESLKEKPEVVVSDISEVPNDTEQPPQASQSVTAQSSESALIIQGQLEQFIRDWEGKYWMENEFLKVQCVGGVKLYMQEALGLQYKVWAPATNPNLGWPPIAVSDFLDKNQGIVAKIGTTTINGLTYSYQVVPILPEDHDKLQPGDIMIMGKSGNFYFDPKVGMRSEEVGHTGIFVGYPDNNPHSEFFTMFDQNGEFGNANPNTEYYQFHSFPKSKLNERAIALRIVLQRK